MDKTSFLSNCSRPFVGVLDSNALVNAADAVFKCEPHIRDQAEFRGLFETLSEANSCIFLVPSFVEEEITKLHHRHRRGAQQSLVQPSRNSVRTDTVFLFVSNLFKLIAHVVYHTLGMVWPGTPCKFGVRIPTKKSFLTYRSTGLVLSVLKDPSVLSLFDAHMFQPDSVDLSLLHLVKSMMHALQLDVVLVTNDKILQLIATIHDVACAGCELTRESAGLLYAERNMTLYSIQKLFRKHFETLWTDALEVEFRNDPVTALTTALCTVDADKRLGKRSFNGKVRRFHSEVIHFHPTRKQAEKPGMQIPRDSISG